MKGERFLSAGLALPLAATLVAAGSCGANPGETKPTPEATCHVGKRPWKDVADITTKNFDISSAAANAGVTITTMEAGKDTGVICDQKLSPDQIHAYRPVHVTRVAQGVGNLCVTYDPYFPHGGTHSLPATAVTDSFLVACPAA